MSRVGAPAASTPGQATATRFASPPPRSAADLSDRSLAIVAAALQAYALFDLARLVLLPANGRPWAVAAVAVAAVTCALSLVLRRRRWVAAVNVAAVSVAALTLLADPATWAAGRYLTNVALAVAGLRLSTRAASWYSAVVVLTEALMLGRAAAVLPGTGPGLQGVLLWPVYEAATAATAVLAARALRRSSAAVDVAHASLLRDRRAAEVAVAVERDSTRFERLLHDTVLNTLTAVARGGLDGRRSAVRQRCADCADQVRQLLTTPEADGGTGATALAALVAEAAASLRATGCRVEVDDVDLRDLSADVRGALVGAVSEALRNVERHAAATEVHVRVTRSGGRLVVQVRDDGRGFDPDSTPPRLGVSRAVLAAMAGVGGAATIESRPGAGTVVTVSWQPERVARLGIADDVASAVAAVVPAVLLPFLAVAWLSAAVTWREVVAPGATVAALLLYSALAVVLLRTAARRRSYRTGDVLLGLAGAAALSILAAVGLGGSIAVTGGDFSSWSDEAVLSVLLVLTALGPPWTLAPALVLQVAVHGFDRAELIGPGGVMLLAVGLFSWSIRRQARRHEQAVAEASAERVRRDAAAQSVARRVRRYRSLADGALPLLDSLASGDADPADPAMRHAARVEERYVRTLVTVDPAGGPAEAMVVHLADTARRHALVLHADVVLPPAAGSPADLAGVEVDPARVKHAEESLAAVLERLPADGVEPRLTVMAESGALAVRLVGPLPERPPPPDGLVFETLSGQGLWETAIPHG